MKSWLNKVVLAVALVGAAASTRAQLAVPPPAPIYQPLSDQQLDQLLAPIALYPDPLVAQILPASTLPMEVVLADRYVDGGGDPSRIDEQPWDPSVQALARYPTVLKWMDDNLTWTEEVGQAFLYQQPEVMDSIQRLRRSAYNLGNLQSTPQQQVIDDGGYLEIVPVEIQVIYVPVYQPNEIYYQSGFGISFGLGLPIGAWLNCDFDWAQHDVIVWHHSHPRPPNWWHEPRRRRDTSHTTVWHRHDNPPAGGRTRGDRGWNLPPQQPVVATVGRSVSDSAAPRRTPAPAARPAMPANRASTPVSQPQSSGAFIGIQSSHETRTYSERGQQSMRTITHPAPAPRPSPAPGPAGGHDHNSNSHDRH